MPPCFVGRLTAVKQTTNTRVFRQHYNICEAVSQTNNNTKYKRVCSELRPAVQRRISAFSACSASWMSFKHLFTLIAFLTAFDEPHCFQSFFISEFPQAENLASSCLLNFPSRSMLRLTTTNQSLATAVYSNLTDFRNICLCRPKTQKTLSYLTLPSGQVVTPAQR